MLLTVNIEKCGGGKCRSCRMRWVVETGERGRCSRSYISASIGRTRAAGFLSKINVIARMARCSLAARCSCFQNSLQIRSHSNSRPGCAPCPNPVALDAIVLWCVCEGCSTTSLAPFYHRAAPVRHPGTTVLGVPLSVLPVPNTPDAALRGGQLKDKRLAICSWKTTPTSPMSAS